MRRNVEIKARVGDLAAVRERAGNLTGGDPVVLKQVDTFFHCASGRLKLRQLADSIEPELIYYDRPDETGPRECHYEIYRAADPDSLRATLSAALGVRGVVRKTRTLYLVGASRVHLDEVEGLGSFVEIEVVLEPRQDTADGAVIVQQLMSKLGIETEQLIDKAYIDLLDAGSRPYEREPK